MLSARMLNSLSLFLPEVMFIGVFLKYVLVLVE